MLNELPTIGSNHLMQREYLANRHMRMMRKILKKNASNEKYWILGTIKTIRRSGKSKITPIMEAVYTLPEVSKESYVYEVDNTAGTQTLLWVMHPNNKLSLPSLGKSIHAAGESGV